MPNITESVPTHEELVEWHDKIVSLGSISDGAFFHWHIKLPNTARAASFIVERAKPIGGKRYFILHCKWLTIRK